MQVGGQDSSQANEPCLNPPTPEVVDGRLRHRFIGAVQVVARNVRWKCRKFRLLQVEALNLNI
jgi:hypothetical protein